MALGNKIVIAGKGGPKGTFIEGIVSGTPKPGTVMEIKWAVAAVGPSGTDFTWEPYGTTAADGIKGVGADGDRRLIAVLDIDKLQGKTATDAYVSGSRCFLYVPAAGELLNMLMLDISGTGDDHALGDILMVNDGDGKLIETTGDPESEPFMCLEVATNPLADALLMCMYTGST